MSGAIPLLPLHAFILWTGKGLTLLFILLFRLQFFSPAFPSFLLVSDLPLSLVTLCRSSPRINVRDYSLSLVSFLPHTCVCFSQLTSRYADLDLKKRGSNLCRFVSNAIVPHPVKPV
jgi:hypothetical protein